MNDFIKVLKQCWPFFKDVFINNEELKDHAKKPSFIAKMFGALVIFCGIIYYLVFFVGSTFDQSRRNYEGLNDSYVKLQTKYQKLIDRRGSMYDQYNELRQEYERLDDAKRELQQQIEQLNNEKGNSAQQSLSEANRKIIEQNKHLIGENKALRTENNEFSATISGLRSEKKTLAGRLKEAVDKSCSTNKKGEEWKSRVKNLLKEIE